MRAEELLRPPTPEQAAALADAEAKHATAKAELARMEEAVREAKSLLNRAQEALNTKSDVERHAVYAVKLARSLAGIDHAEALRLLRLQGLRPWERIVVCATGHNAGHPGILDGNGEKRRKIALLYVGRDTWTGAPKAVTDGESTATALGSGRWKCSGAEWQEAE